MIPRIFYSLLGAAFVAFGIFWLLQSLVRTNQNEITHQENIRVIDFVRLERESKLQKKERIKPKKPEPLPKPQPKTEVLQEKVSNKKMVAGPIKLDLEIPLSFTAKGMLGDAIVERGLGVGMEGRELGTGAVNTNVIPLSRINPIYPRRAKMKKIEGYVQAEFTITESGNVKDIEIIKSYPEGIFETSAKRALIRWTFKPKMEKGKAVPQRAGLTINFRLNP